MTRPSKDTQGSNLKCKVPQLVSSPPRAIWSGSVLGGVGVTIALSDQARRANCTWPQFLTFDKETRLTEDLNFHSGSINHSLLTPNFHTVSVIRLRPSKGCSVWAHLDLSHGNFSAESVPWIIGQLNIEIIALFFFYKCYCM
jgi:hypothetical protein